jgi:hypothetical protein
MKPKFILTLIFVLQVAFSLSSFEEESLEKFNTGLDGTKESLEVLERDDLNIFGKELEFIGIDEN